MNQCSKVIKVAGGSTSAMHNHLKTCINLLKTNIGVTHALLEQIHLLATFKKINNPQPFCFWNMLFCSSWVKYGLSFHVFWPLTHPRLDMVAKRPKEIPKSVNTIKKMVVDYRKTMHGIITKKISEIKSNKKFSLTFDEWISVRIGIKLYSTFCKTFLEAWFI